MTHRPQGRSPSPSASAIVEGEPPSTQPSSTETASGVAVALDREPGAVGVSLATSAAPPIRDWRPRCASRAWRRPSAVSVLAVLGVLILGFAMAARLAPVRERGRLLPFFEDYEVVRVDLFGVAVYADTSFGFADAATAAGLAVLAAALLGTAHVLHARRRPEARPLALAGAGAAFLAGDDLLAAHETVGHNLGVLAPLLVVDHPDDLIVGAYFIVAVAFAWRHRDLLRGAPRGPWALAMVLAGAAVIHDVSPLHLTAFEESAEIGAGVAGLAAVGTSLRRLMARP